MNIMNCPRCSSLCPFICICPHICDAPDWLVHHSRNPLFSAVSAIWLIMSPLLLVVLKDFICKDPIIHNFTKWTLQMESSEPIGSIWLHSQSYYNCYSVGNVYLFLVILLSSYFVCKQVLSSCQLFCMCMIKC